MLNKVFRVLMGVLILKSPCFSCDFQLLERNGERLFSSIWNKRTEEVTQENILSSLSFVHNQDLESVKKISAKDILFYGKILPNGMVNEDFTSRKEFPEIVLKHPYYTDLSKNQTFRDFMEACQSIISQYKNESTSFAVRLLNSEVMRKLFRHHHMILEMRSILNGSSEIVSSSQGKGAKDHNHKKKRENQLPQPKKVKREGWQEGSSQKTAFGYMVHSVN